MKEGKKSLRSQPITLPPRSVSLPSFPALCKADLFIFWAFALLASCAPKHMENEKKTHCWLAVGAQVSETSISEADTERPVP